MHSSKIYSLIYNKNFSFIYFFFGICNCLHVSSIDHEPIRVWRHRTIKADYLVAHYSFFDGFFFHYYFISFLGTLKYSIEQLLIIKWQMSMNTMCVVDFQSPTSKFHLSFFIWLLWWRLRAESKFSNWPSSSSLCYIYV